MDKTRGFAGRSIVAPGYHLHPQYDLVHTRHLLHSRHGKKSFELMLAPMVDMFSILVIYLIMNFSSTGEVFFIAKDIKIPQVTKGAPMDSFPLISVVKGQIMFDAPAIGGHDSVYIEEPNDGVNKGLRAKLAEIKALEAKIPGDKETRSQINIQADERTDVEEVKKIMRVLIEEGWNTINLIVEPNSTISI